MDKTTYQGESRESEKYSRQELVIGEEGQTKLRESSVAIIGVGALGSVVAELLCRAGIGRLVLIDRDVVEESNLQRQILYCEKDVGRSKVAAAKDRLCEINSEVEVSGKGVHLSAKNINLLDGVEVVLDCTDNMKTRLLLNDYCHREHKKWIYGAAIGTKGYVMAMVENGPCLRCFLEESNLETCASAGVLSMITSAIGSMQASMALRMIVKGKVKTQLYYFDVWGMIFRELGVSRKEGCRTCERKYDYLEVKEESKVVRFCSTERYEISGRVKGFTDVAMRLSKIGEVVYDGDTLRFENILLFVDGRALIKANSEEEALASYSKYIGD